MEICSAFIGSTLVAVMLAAIQGRRKLIEYSWCQPGAVLDSATGLFILAAGVVSLWLMHSVTSDTNNAVYQISSELTKLLTGAIGAMYLKQGYEQHDRDAEKNRLKRPCACPATSNASASDTPAKSGGTDISNQAQNPQGDRE